MNTEILKLREKVDSIDYEILKLLEKRKLVVRQVINLRKQNNLKLEDKNREQFVFKDRKNKTNLSPDFIESFFCMIIKECKGDIK